MRNPFSKTSITDIGGFVLIEVDPRKGRPSRRTAQQHSRPLAAWPVGPDERALTRARLVGATACFRRPPVALRSASYLPDYETVTGEPQERAQPHSEASPGAPDSLPGAAPKSASQSTAARCRCAQSFQSIYGNRVLK